MLAAQTVAKCKLLGENLVLKARIADLRERHEAFVRKIREQAGDERFTDAYSINRIIALCDAELSGEQSNG